MVKRILFLLGLLMLLLSCSKEDKTIKIATAGYPMEEIVKIASEDLQKQGYKVEITKLTDYVTANKGLNAKDFDANFHQHEPFMQVFNSRNSGTLVKVAPVYNVYVGFYSEKYKNKDELPQNAVVSIPNDPTNQDRALRILAKEGIVTLKNKDGLYTPEDIESSPKNIKINPVQIPSLVQAYKESDLTFNWPSHMLKIGVNVKDALFIENDDTNKYAVMLASREDNKDSQKIKDLAKAITSENVRKFLQEKYADEGYPVF